MTSPNSDHIKFVNNNTSPTAAVQIREKTGGITFWNKCTARRKNASATRVAAAAVVMVRIRSEIATQDRVKRQDGTFCFALDPHK